MRCDKHMDDGMPSLTATGTCENCGNGTNRMFKKLCDACSDTLKQCQICRVPVTGTTDTTPSQTGSQ